jgi:hypothetical protein
MGMHDVEKNIKKLSIYFFQEVLKTWDISDYNSG